MTFKIFLHSGDDSSSGRSPETKDTPSVAPRRPVPPVQNSPPQVKKYSFFQTSYRSSYWKDNISEIHPHTLDHVHFLLWFK